MNRIFASKGFTIHPAPLQQRSRVDRKPLACEVDEPTKIVFGSFYV